MKRAAAYRRARVLAGLGLALAAAGAAFVYLGLAVLPSPPALAHSASHVNPACQDHDGSHDQSAPFSISAPAGLAIEAVCIKSGTKEFRATSNGYVSSGNVAECYLVSGIGSRTVTVVKTGAGTAQNCQDISYIAAFWTQPTPTGTPVTPTATNPAATPTSTSAAPTSTSPAPTPTATNPSGAPTASSTPAGPPSTPAPNGTTPPAQTAEVQQVLAAPAAPLVAEVQLAQALPSTGSGGYLDDKSMAVTWFGIVMLLSGISTMGYAVRLATMED